MKTLAQKFLLQQASSLAGTLKEGPSATQKFLNLQDEVEVIGQQKLFILSHWKTNSLKNYSVYWGKKQIRDMAS